MNGSTFSQAYANNLIFELEKAFWDERGKGARFRVTNVGQAYYQSACAPLLQSSEVDDMVKAIESALQRDGIARRVSAERDGQLLRVRVEGCLHRPVEDRMVTNNTRPFACVPANLIVMAVEEKLDRPAELAEIKLEEGACQLLLVLFDKRPFLE